MNKLLTILLCLPMIGFSQDWEATYIGCSQDEIKELINYISTIDQNTLEKITKRKQEGKKIKKKEKIILETIKQLDPNSLFNLNKDIDKQINYLEILSPEECTRKSIDNYLEKELRYPPIAWDAGITGKVFVSYKINIEGDVTDVEIVRGVDKYLDAEALRVVKSLPKFKPAKKRGKAISTQYTIYVEFIY